MKPVQLKGQKFTNNHEKFGPDYIEITRQLLYENTNARFFYHRGFYKQHCKIVLANGPIGLDRSTLDRA